MFNFIKKNGKSNFDISNVSKDNVNKFLKLDQLKLIYLISPDLSLIFSDFNINKISSWTIILLIAFLVMVLYEIYWIRY